MVEPASLGQKLQGAPEGMQLVGPPTDEADFQQKKAGIFSFLTKPEVQAALMQFAINLTQSRPQGQSSLGHTTQAVGAGLRAAGRVTTAREKKEGLDEDRDLKRRDVVTREGQLGLNKKAQSDKDKLAQARLLIEERDSDLRAEGLGLKERALELDREMREAGVSLADRKLILAERGLELDENKFEQATSMSEARLVLDQELLKLKETGMEDQQLRTILKEKMIDAGIESADADRLLRSRGLDLKESAQEHQVSMDEARLLIKEEELKLQSRKLTDVEYRTELIEIMNNANIEDATQNRILQERGLTLKEKAQEHKEGIDEARLALEDAGLDIRERNMTDQEYRTELIAAMNESQISIADQNIILKEKGLELQIQKFEHQEDMDKVLMKLREADHELKVAGSSVEERRQAFTEELAELKLDFAERKLVQQAFEAELNAPVKEIIDEDGVRRFALQKDSVGEEVAPTGRKLSRIEEKTTNIYNNMIQNGYSEKEANDTATKIANGVYAVHRNPVNNRVSIIDQATKQELYVVQAGEAPAATPNEVPASPPSPSSGESSSGPDIGAATGLRGYITGKLNAVVDALERGLVNPNNTEAAITVENLTNRTVTLLSAAMEGRQTNMLREDLKKLVPQANAIFTGRETAKIYFEKMRERISRELQRIDTDILDNAHAFQPPIIQKNKLHASNLADLLQEYDEIIASFGFTPEILQQMSCQELAQVSPRTLGENARNIAKAQWSILGCKLN